MSHDSLLLGLIGQGLTLSRTPALHEAEGLEHGISTVYRRLDPLTGPLRDRSLVEILDAVRITGFNGLNITHPYKQEVLPLLDEVSDQAAQLGSVNTVVISPEGRLMGYNTDTSGFARGLEECLSGVPMTTAVQVGAGGAGNAVAYALATHGVEHLYVADLQPARAQALAESINEIVGRQAVEGVGLDGIEETIAGASGVVNATPMGTLNHPGTAFDTSCLTPHHWVADVVYMPVETQLLTDARARGCHTLDGTRMAVHQAVDAFELFTGIAPCPERMRKTFLSLELGPVTKVV